MVRGPGEQAGDDDRDGIGSEAIAIGTDERRMHVRAYNHWISLLRGRSCPGIADLDPGSIADFGANSVLLDFTGGIEDPAIRFLGHALRAECGADASITRISQVPHRSLLSRLTDHYLQIIANEAPIGFEAEFVGNRGFPMMYRGILMPFSSTGAAIDYLYGVINWKEVVDDATQSLLTAELEESRRAAPRPTLATAWADGPSGGFANDVDGGDALPDRLVLARDHADAAQAAETMSRDALHDALGSAYDFALAAERDPAGLRELLEDAGIAADPAAPMEVIARLVFGQEPSRIADHATLLTHVRRLGVGEGTLPALLGDTPGGVAAVLRDAAGPAAAGFVVLLGRVGGDADVTVLGRVDADPVFVVRAIRQLAA